MSVALGVSAFAPYVCAVYTCECGRRVTQHGSKSGVPPTGWETRAGHAHLCEVCCGKPPRRAT